MANVLPSVTAKICSRYEAGSKVTSIQRERPFHRKGLRSRTYMMNRESATRNPMVRRGLRICSAIQRIVARSETDLQVTDKKDRLKRRSYRFQTDNGGIVSVCVEAKQFTYTLHVEVSDMPPGFNEDNLALRWQTFRSDKLNQSEPDSNHSSELTLTQSSPGRHTVDLEADYSEIPTYLSFYVYSSLSADGSNEMTVRTARKTSFRVPMGFAPGNPMPLGLSFFDDGTVNFSLVSKNADRVLLCLFEDHSNKASLEIELDPYVHRTGDIWHASLENVSKYVSYGYRCDGNLLHNGGSITYLDPYARLIRSLPPGNGDSSISCLTGSLQKLPSFDWSGDVRLDLPTEKLVVYRLNVSKFTQDESSRLPEDIAGTFSGVIKKIQHFKDMGINAVLLEPIFSFDEKQGSYFPYNFFTPMNKYGPNGDGETAMNSMKEMVKSLHVNGIEVFLEVNFTHTAEGHREGYGFLGIDGLSYYADEGKRSGAANSLDCSRSVVQKMIIDSLRHWVTDFHIDGFCFVNASNFTKSASGPNSSRPALIESIAFDPILSNTKLIADSWSPHDMLYHEIDFPHWKRWSEINSRFCKDARNFLRGKGLLGDLATRLCGSGDIFSGSRGPAYSFNFVTKNSGLSLVDLVSFSGNKLSSEFSWNCGEEGPTSKNAILETRLRQIRNFLFLLFVSLGVPVLNMGDECGLSNGGSTSYHERCPFDWDYLETSFARQVTQFISFLSSLRERRSDIFQRKAFHKVENIQWHGAYHSEPKWDDPSSKFLALMLRVEKDDNTPDSDEGDVFIAFNAGDVSSIAVLPETSASYEWFRLVDTSCSFPGFFYDGDDLDWCQLSKLKSYELKPYACCLFEARLSS